MFRQSVTYGIKNFYKQLGLSQHFTIKGLLRRTQRQYPRTFKITKFCIIFCVVASTSMLFIPGHTLPFQSHLKYAVMRRAEQFCNTWYMQIGIPDPLMYALMTYQIIYYHFDQDMLSPQAIAFYLNKINNILEPNSLKLNKVKNYVKIEHIINSVQVLKKMIENYEKTQNSNNLLNNSLILKQFDRIVDNSILCVEGELKDANRQHFALSIKIFQYLLKFQEPKNKKVILQKTVSLLKDPSKAFFAFEIMKNDQFKKELKCLLKSNSELAPNIQQLLQTVETVRKNQLKP